MALQITDDLKYQIIEANPLVEVMKEYGVELNSKGKTLCPFHREKTPSFTIRTRDASIPVDQKNKDTYYCYGCAEGGDVIDFLMRKEDCSYVEAIRTLADRGSIILPDVKKDPAIEKIKDERTEVNRSCYLNLQNDKDALKYLHDRGFNEEDFKKWRIGMVPWDFSDKRYAGRIVFGIMEANDYKPQEAKTIALAYRARELKDYAIHGWDLSDEKKVQKALNPKYYNDGKSVAYEKSKVLYGLNYAAKPIRKEKFAVLMEGYVDVIMAHKYGLPQAVAACGTSITEEQVKLLRRYTDQVFLWLDGDAAGQNSMIKNLPKFLKEGFKVLIVESPGMDPAEVAEEYGDLAGYLRSHSFPAVQLVINKTMADYDAMLNKARTQALETLMPLLDQIQRPAERINYSAVVEQRLGVKL